MATFDVVFEGGGAKGTALSGGVEAILKGGHKLRRLIGTSAGAITATNLAVGYTPREILEGSTAKGADGKSIYAGFMDPPKKIGDAQLMDSAIFRMFVGMRTGLMPKAAADKMDLATLHALSKVPGFLSLFSLSEAGGYYAGDAFLQWMRDCLDADGRGYADATFATLFAATGRDLSVAVTDTTTRRLLILNHRTAPACPVAWGVRMSMSIPFLWTEVRWKTAWGSYLGEDISGHALVDGGVLSNFPLRLLAAPNDPEVVAWMGPAPEEEAMVLGFHLDPSLTVPNADKHPACPPPDLPLLGRVEALVDTLLSANDNAIAAAHSSAVCRLPVKGFGVTEFDMPSERVEALYQAAVVAGEEWLRNRGLETGAAV